MALMSLAHLSILAQVPVTDPVIGQWRGLSVCQIKSSPCSDEEVVYHIAAGATSDTYTVQMNKIVDGKEEEMGALTCILNKSTMELSDNLNPDASWTFSVGKRVMRGTLIYRERLYRIIRVKRVR